MSIGKTILGLLQLLLTMRMASGSCMCLSFGCPMCAAATSDSVAANLDFCGITDADLPVLDACLTQIGRDKIGRIYLNENRQLTTLTEDIFREMPALTSLNLDETAMALLPSGLFNDTPSLTHIYLQVNQLESLPSGLLDGATSLQYLALDMNSITELPSGLFDSTLSLTTILLSENQLTTFPAGLMDNLGRVENLPPGASSLTVSLYNNPDLQCIPSTCAECSVVIDVDDWFTGGICGDGTPAPTPAPTDLDGIISCDLWECGAGYTSVQRDCSTHESPYGRRLQATDDDVNGGFYTTDGYTTLGNYPICSQEACCDQAPTPAPTPAPTVSGGTTCGTTGIEGILGTNDSGSVCCPSGCTTCGGSGCGTVGAAQGLDNTDCCINGVLRSQDLCSASGTAPCVINGAATCVTAGVEGIIGTNDHGSVCCPLGCTQCGGSGCAKIGKLAGLDGTDCCINGVLENQDPCSSSGIAPCVL